MSSLIALSDQKETYFFMAAVSSIMSPGFKRQKMNRINLNPQWNMRWRLLVTASVVLSSVLLSGPAQSEQVIWRSEEQMLQITDLDIEADAHTIDLAVRNHALSDARKVEMVGKGLFVRAAVAEQAKAKGLDKSPQAQARLKLAEQKVLMELMLEELEKTQAPSKEQLLKYAEAEYKANPQRFEAPAETKASHILLFADSPNAEQRIQELYQQLKSGADFGELAFKYSEDGETAPLYGSLGYFDPKNMVMEFQSVLAGLKKEGEYSEPFKTRFGWHIVRLEGRREAGKLSFDEVREVLMEQGRKAAMSDLRDNLVEKSVAQIKTDEQAMQAFTEKHKKLADEQRGKH
ncbi:hypothetical protein CK623_06620 [Vandammella animalimorsus]|uniref:peptidylprolyl isomerase n=2 Tax=Vandammella animalimorsus TaxID=2029117 RepID=A0A2A2ANK1_9BURK|nr:hypothetical protein CK623_06620 [Vandammella animalimorsus]